MTVPKATKRLRPNRGLGAGHTRARRNAVEKVRQQRAAREEEARRQARLERERAQKRAQTNVEMADQRFRHATLAGVTRSLRQIIDSWGFNHVSIDFGVREDLDQVEAYTNWSRIVIRWPASLIPAKVTQTKELAGIVAEMRGVALHEGLHLKLTAPYEHVAKHVSTYGPVAPDFLYNMMEDQRIETIGVVEFPKAANYFTTMVVNRLVNTEPEKAIMSWLSLAGRTYLPVDILDASYDMFDEYCNGVGVPGGADYWQLLMDEFCAATTVERMGEVVDKANQFLEKLGIQYTPPIVVVVDSHRAADRWGSYTFDPSTLAQHALKDGDIKRSYTKIDRTVGEYEGRGGGGQSDHGAGVTGFQDAIIRTKEEMDKRNTTDREASTVMRNAMVAADATGLPEYTGAVASLTDEQVEVANTVAKDILFMLSSFQTQNEPTWEFGTPTGVLDVLRYRTRDIGDRLFRRELNTPEQRKPSVHLSLLADCSGSMGSNMVPLSQVMYGAAKACEEIGIGSSFVLWSTDESNYRVWSDGNHEPVLFPSMGGTDPTQALDDLDNHNPENADTHLVVIFTDGAWGSFPTLQRWNGDGERTIVVVRYGYHDGSFQGDLGADHHIQINNVLDLGGHLADSLKDVLEASIQD